MTRLIKSFGYAVAGVQSCVMKEANFKIHIAVAILVTIAGFYFNIAKIEWMVLALCFGFVISMELVNTAIEQLCNFIHVGHSPVIKIIKDVAAGAVLVSAIAATACGLIIFLPKIIF